MASYFHPFAIRFTAATSRAGVSFCPDGALRGSVSPLTSIFTWVPPTSMTRIFSGDSFFGSAGLRRGTYPSR